MEKSLMTTSQSEEIKEKKRYPFIVDLFVRLVKGKPLGTIGGIIVLMLVVVGSFANFLAPYGMNEIILVDTLDPPSLKHLLGTDNVGRDLLSRIIYGARISMFVGIGAASLSTLIATLIGLISGYFGGKVDIVLQRFVDAMMCFPSLVFYLTVMAIIGPGLLKVIIVLGIHSGMSRSRVIRGAVIAIRQNVYLEATRAIGASHIRSILKHVLPNVLAPIITIFAVASGYMILAEATLSFLGFGVPPPAPSWGGMLSHAGRKYMYDAPWMAIFPGAALGIVVFGMNMLGDALRDLLDPRLRGGLGRYGKASLRVGQSDKEK
ncbi:ABC transporter permease [Chloroflexota bacterium]